MEFGNESSVNPNPVIEGLLLSQVSSRSRDEGPCMSKNTKHWNIVKVNIDFVI